jgi:hypothetical protein
VPFVVDFVFIAIKSAPQYSVSSGPSVISPVEESVVTHLHDSQLLRASHEVTAHAIKIKDNTNKEALFIFL